MVTRKQIEANKNNAKKGGVKTEAGKSISRLNATKHGIFSNVVIADHEENEVLDNIRCQVFQELQPNGILEEILVDRFVVCLWRLRRCAIADKAITEQKYLEAKRSRYLSSDSERDRSSRIWVLTHGQIELILRYETTIERQLFRVLGELRSIQEMRRNVDHQTLPQLSTQ